MPAGLWALGPRQVRECPQNGAPRLGGDHYTLGMAQGSERVVMFDDGSGRLWPLTDMRASFEVRTGALTTLERWRRVFRAAGVEFHWVFVGRGLEGTVREAQGAEPGGGLRVNDCGTLGGEGALAVSGRWVMARDGEFEQARGLRVGDAMVSERGTVLAARLEGGALRLLVEDGTLAAGCRRIVIEGAAVLERAWDVIRWRDGALASDLTVLLGEMPSSHEGVVTKVNPRAIGIAESARISPGVVLDAEKGPIVIDENGVVRPNAIIIGPAYVGKNTTVLDGAVIRGGTAIGPVCKVNGEVSNTIFQGCANKAHDGFIGDSFVGAWVNLGAGTITSNLLNTYSEISACPSADEDREKTGLTFFGSVIGDHAKTAIGTRLTTGSMVGTGAMIALGGSAPACVGNFAWLAEGRSQLYRLSRFLHVCEIVMSRRGVSLSEPQRVRLTSLHDAVTRTLVAAPGDYQI